MEWEDAEDIAEALLEAHPEVDPLTMSFPKMHKMVTELADFDDDPGKSNEGILERIQMAWLEAYQAQKAEGGG